MRVIFIIDLKTFSVIFLSVLNELCWTLKAQIVFYVCVCVCVVNIDIKIRHARSFIHFIFYSFIYL